jgi:hypothetical protein
MIDIHANAGWHEAAAWIKGELEKMGFSDAVLEGWPSGLAAQASSITVQPIPAARS